MSLALDWNENHVVAMLAHVWNVINAWRMLPGSKCRYDMLEGDQTRRLRSSSTRFYVMHFRGIVCNVWSCIVMKYLPPLFAFIDTISTQRFAFLCHGSNLYVYLCARALYDSKNKRLLFHHGAFGLLFLSSAGPSPYVWTLA